MKVMTFNIRVHVESDGENAWPHRIENVARVINEEAALVFGMQEATVKMMDDLKPNIPAYDWVGKVRREGEEYSAIFFQKDVVEVVHTETFWLSENPEVEGSLGWDADYPRICTWAEFKFKANPRQKFRVFNTHLDHMGVKARINGIRLVLEKIKEQNNLETLPTFLTGDFNAEPNSDVIQFIKTQTTLKDAYSLMPHPGATFHDFKGGDVGAPIDYIFASCDIASVAINKTTTEGRYPSDHYPVIIEVENLFK